MNLIKPVNKEVLNHNQHYLEKFGNHACQQSAKVVFTVAQTQLGEFHLTAIDNASPEQLATICEQLAKDLRIQGRNKITHA